jgi:hypothetical protein
MLRGQPQHDLCDLITQYKIAEKAQIALEVFALVDGEGASQCAAFVAES